MLLAIPLLAGVLGCAGPSRSCDCIGGGGRCALGTVACGVYHGTLADEIMCCNAGCLSQSRPGCICPRARCGRDCYGCRECRLAPLGFIDSIGDKPQPGPPPVTFRPEMPAKFLAVPTHAVVSPVPPEAPERQRGNVEVGYRKELTIPGRD